VGESGQGQVPHDGLSWLESLQQERLEKDAKVFKTEEGGGMSEPAKDNFMVAIRALERIGHLQLEYFKGGPIDMTPQEKMFCLGFGRCVSLAKEALDTISRSDPNAQG